jgi:DNA-binding LacI/PurR family transcriptional regulator
MRPKAFPVRSNPKLEDIAREAGVNRSTVSLALRDHPRISLERRQQVQAIAKRLGYRINPLVAALMQSRRSRSRPRNVVIGYLTNYPTRYGWRPTHHARPDYFPGAVERAAELGYKLEHFWMGEPGMTPERMSDILTVRGIHGILLGRLPPGHQSLRLLWERFSCVALGRTLVEPDPHRVAEDFFASASIAMEELVKRGYRRIGLVFTEFDDSPVVGSLWTGSYFAELFKHRLVGVTEPLAYEDEADHTERFAAWYRQQRPDAILATRPEAAMRWLSELGLKAPRDVGLASVGLRYGDGRHSGVYCDPAKLGGLAAEILVGLMQRGETGLPADPYEVLIPGHWVEGETVARRIKSGR